jgi:hypothetical protein
MGPLLVIFDQPVIGDLLHLVEGLEQVGVEHLRPIRAVNRSMKAFWFGLPGSMKRNAIPRCSAHSTKACEVSSLPLSRRSAAGWPYSSMRCSSMRIVRRLGIEVPISIPRACRFASSSTFRVRNRRPSYSASSMKSIDQT